MSENRRSAPRHNIVVTAEVTADGEIHEGMTRNLSTGGVNVELQYGLADAMVVQLALLLTEDGVEDAEAGPFEVASTVMWSAPTDSGAFMVGLRFGTLSKAQQVALGAFIERETRGSR